MEGEELGELVLLDEVPNGHDSADILKELFQLIFLLLSNGEMLVGALLIDGPLLGVIEEVSLEMVVDAALKGCPKLAELHLVHVEELKMILGR